VLAAAPCSLRAISASLVCRQPSWDVCHLTLHQTVGYVVPAQPLRETAKDPQVAQRMLAQSRRCVSQTHPIESNPVVYTRWRLQALQLIVCCGHNTMDRTTSSSSMPYLKHKSLKCSSAWSI
jgi:hypothetical protein